MTRCTGATTRYASSRSSGVSNADGSKVRSRGSSLDAPLRRPSCLRSNCMDTGRPSPEGTNLRLYRELRPKRTEGRRAAGLGQGGEHRARARRLGGPQGLQRTNSGADFVDALPVLLQRFLPFQRQLRVGDWRLPFVGLLDLDQAGVGELREVAREVPLRQAGDVQQEQEVRLVARGQRDE